MGFDLSVLQNLTVTSLYLDMQPSWCLANILGQFPLTKRMLNPPPVMFGVWSPLTISGSGTKTLANPRRRPSNNDVSIWTTFWLKLKHHCWLKKAPASPKLLQLFPDLPPHFRFIGCVWRSCISTNPSLWRTPKAGSLSISWFSRHPRIWAHSTAPATQHQQLIGVVSTKRPMDATSGQLWGARVSLAMPRDQGQACLPHRHATMKEQKSRKSQRRGSAKPPTSLYITIHPTKQY
jgi:hypothetical protein